MSSLSAKQLLIWQRSLQAQTRPTKRAPDAGDSAAISGSFLRLFIFLAGRLRRPRPSAGNANRWAAGAKTLGNIFTFTEIVYVY